ncbi:hypothetical protein Hanom_Chr05g00447181 [Helianthus anomalus]
MFCLWSRIMIDLDRDMRCSRSHIFLFSPIGIFFGFTLVKIIAQFHFAFCDILAP